MQRLAVVFALLILPLLGIIAPAESNQYTSTASSQISSDDPTNNCQTKLGNKAYNCNVVSSSGSNGTTCFQFVSPGSMSSNFDLIVRGTGTLGCSCKATGSISNPTFNGSPKSFSCVAGEGYAFSGKKTGKELTGYVQASSGDSFLFACTQRSSKCPTSD
jgi:hypothetical protein